MLLIFTLHRTRVLFDVSEAERVANFSPWIAAVFIASILRFPRRFDTL